MTAGAERIKDVNTRYHDAAAAEYNAKWTVNFDADSQATVTGKLEAAIGRPLGTFGRSLEVGAGTGYFTLNLLAAGAVREAVATDISPGMLERLATSAGRQRLAVEAIRAEADRLPFPDDSFDLVMGHAVLHHLPDPEAAFAEFARVLRPGGTLAFCGEPSAHGDRLAALPKRGALAAAPAWRFLMRASKRGSRNGPLPAGAGGRERAPEGASDPELVQHELEWLVDVHAFTPGQLRALAADAGLERVRVRGEELAANWFGWVSRTFEGSAEPDEVPRAWRWYAYGGYRALRAVDRVVLEPHLPPAIFYNLLLSARAPT